MADAEEESVAPAATGTVIAVAVGLAVAAMETEGAGQVGLLAVEVSATVIEGADRRVAVSATATEGHVKVATAKVLLGTQPRLRAATGMTITSSPSSS